MLGREYVVMPVSCDGTLAEYDPTSVELAGGVVAVHTLNDAWVAAAEILKDTPDTAVLIHDRLSDLGEGSLLIRRPRLNATPGWEVDVPANPPRLWEQVEDLADELAKLLAKRKDK